MENRYVESYYINELPNGVIHLLINCTQREIYYHAYNDNTFLIAGTEEEYEEGQYNFEIEEFLDRTKAFLYIQTSMKEKEQLNFYYIPYQREWIKQIKRIK